MYRLKKDTSRCTCASANARWSPAVRASCERLAPPLVCLLAGLLGLHLLGKCSCARCSACGAKGSPPHPGATYLHSAPFLPIPQPATPSRLHVITFLSAPLVPLSLSSRLLSPFRPRHPCLSTWGTPPQRSLCPARPRWAASRAQSIHCQPALPLVGNLPCSIPPLRGHSGPCQRLAFGLGPRG